MAARLKSIQMADTLYLSLWYPNLRLEALPDKLIAVLGAFAAHGGEAKVYSATVWPVSWNETPVFERIYGRMAGLIEPGQVPGAEPRQAVEEATELLHEDYAYEFQIGWNLWELETGPAESSTEQRSRLATRAPARRMTAESSQRLDARWARGPKLVRVTGYGPLFDEGAYEQDGHIRIDFGSDAPFLEEDVDLS